MFFVWYVFFVKVYLIMYVYLIFEVGYVREVLFRKFFLFLGFVNKEFLVLKVEFMDIDVNVLLILNKKF